MALDMSSANAALMTALAKAQQAASTVGKDGRNTQRNYNYSTAEAMVRAAREAMADTGLAVLSTWTQEPAELPEGGDIGNQFACATVIEHFVLTHAEGGYISGRAEIDAIASRARPYDKAVAAAATYMHGFVLRHLLNLDRSEEGEAAVDRRGDDSFDPRRGQRRQQPQGQPQSRRRQEQKPGGWRANAEPHVQQADKVCRELVRERIGLVRELGISREAMEQSTTALLAEILGIEPSKGGYDEMAPRFTLDQWGDINARLRKDVNDLIAMKKTAGEFDGAVEGAAE